MVVTSLTGTQLPDSLSHCKRSLIADPSGSPTAAAPPDTVTL